MDTMMGKALDILLGPLYPLTFFVCVGGTFIASLYVFYLCGAFP